MELRKRHKAHARPLKNLEERYVWYARSIEEHADERRGAWIETFCPGARELHLDLGCGKGQFAIAMAQAHPHVLFVGLDYDRICIARAAQMACELELSNCIFALADGEDVGAYFAPGEIDRMYLNFSTPHPRKKHAAERLTYVDQLIAYRPLLSEGAFIDMKTDSPPFFEFSLVQFDLAGYDVVWSTTDLHAEERRDAGDVSAGADILSARPRGEGLFSGGDEFHASRGPTECRPLHKVKKHEAAEHKAAGDFLASPVTEYEERLCAKGAKVHACRAIKANRPYTNEQTAELSLFEYLPEDLSTLEYVPYGMEGYVFNMSHKRAKEKAKPLSV